MTDSSHPSIDKFKSQAKELKRKTNLSLMQAQTVVAKNNGYNNWHDFVQKLKNIFEPKYASHVKPDVVTSNNFEDVPKDGFFHIGREVTSATEHWLSWNQSRCHVHIIEEHSSIYSLDVYLAQQAIINGQPVLFSSSDIEASKVLINFAFTNNRKRIYLFDTMNQMIDFETYRVHRPRLSLPDTTMSSLSSFLSQYKENLGNVEKDEFMNFLQLVSAITIYQKENEGINTSLNSLMKNGNLIQFQKYSAIFPESHPMKGYLQEGINLFLNDISKQNLFETLYNSIINKIKATNLFNNESADYAQLNFDSLYYEDEEYPIFIFLSNQTQLPKSLKTSINYLELTNLTLMNYYSTLLASILGVYVESRNQYRKKLKNDSIAFIMRNPPLSSFTYGSLAAQNRAIGASFIFTFNHLINVGKPSVEEWLANANNYFFGKFTQKIESDYGIKKLFDKKLSEHLMTQAYHAKTINCEYKSSDIEALGLNEYIFFNQKLLKVSI